MIPPAGSRRPSDLMVRSLVIAALAAGGVGLGAPDPQPASAGNKPAAQSSAHAVRLEARSNMALNFFNGMDL
jgi:hypothetical protein